MWCIGYIAKKTWLCARNGPVGARCLSIVKLETRKNRVILAWRDDVEASGRKNGIVRSDFHDAWR